MQLKHVLLPVLLAAAVVLAPAGPAHAQPAAGKPTRIAVVDITKTFNALTERTQIEADTQQELNKLNAEGEGKAKAIKEKETEVTLLLKGTPDAQRAQDELAMMSISFKTWKDFMELKRQINVGLRYASLYRKMLKAIEATAKENSFDMVLFKEPEPDFTNIKPENIPTAIGLRKVLWSAPELDLTNQVTTKMNNDFSNNVKTP